MSAFSNQSRSAGRFDPAIAIGLILTAGLGLRLLGVSHGFSDFVTGDERVVLRDAVHFITAATLQPQHFNYPAFYSYLYSAAVASAYLVGMIPDVGTSADSVLFAHLFAPTQIALVGRALNVLAGAGLIAVAYLLGQYAYGRSVAFGGAIFAAVSLALIHHSRFALPDMMMALLAAASCAFVVAFLESGGTLVCTCAGLMLGLAVSTKYNAGFVLLGFLVAVILHSRTLARREATAFCLRSVTLFGLAGLIGFLFGSPYWLMSFGEYVQAVLNVASNLQFSLHAVEWPRLMALWSLVRQETVWGVMLIGGVLFAVTRRRDVDLLLLVVILPAFLYIGALPKGSIHYTIFLYPLGGVLAARMLTELTASSSSWVRVALRAGISMPQLWTGIADEARLGQADYRSQAREWIEANIPDGSIIGVYRIDYTPPLKGDIHRNFLTRQIEANRGRPEVVAELQSLRRRFPIYTQLTLEYFAEQALVPSAYRDRVDLRDPKTLETFRRRWMNYDELKQWKVTHMILPSAGYTRFFTGHTPAAGTAAHHHHQRSKSYIEQFFGQDAPRYRVVAEFVGGTEENPKKITVVEVS